MAYLYRAVDPVLGQRGANGSSRKLPPFAFGLSNVGDYGKLTLGCHVQVAECWCPG